MNETVLFGCFLAIILSVCQGGYPTCQENTSECKVGTNQLCRCEKGYRCRNKQGEYTFCEKSVTTCSSTKSICKYRNRIKCNCNTGYSCSKRRGSKTTCQKKVGPPNLNKKCKKRGSACKSPWKGNICKCWAGYSCKPSIYPTRKTKYCKPNYCSDGESGLCKIRSSRKCFCRKGYACKEKRASKTYCKAKITLPTSSQQTCRSLSEAKITAFQANSVSFALELYKQARAEDKMGNIFFSPASISVALGMVLAGARGETKKQIKQKVANDIQDNEISSAYRWLMEEINADKALYKLYTANAMYVQEGMSLKQQFSDSITQCFKSSSEVRDFLKNAEAVRNEVNDWVESKTNNKIQELIKRGVVDAFTRMILVNAIYFKAEWMTPFTEGAHVYKKLFYPLGDEINGKKIEFMKKEMNVPYFENEHMQIIELPYKANELSMYIFLPRKRDGLPEVETDILTTQRLTELTKSKRVVDVTIPKFKLTQDLSLKKILKNMGMHAMFDPSADLSGITGRKGLFVSAAIHKAFIEVNERGTEAGAATAMVISRSASITRAIKFDADHAFMFVIQHKQSRNILFIGSLTTV